MSFFQKSIGQRVFSEIFQAVTFELSEPKFHGYEPCVLAAYEGYNAKVAVHGLISTGLEDAKNRKKIAEDLAAIFIAHTSMRMPKKFSKSDTALVAFAWVYSYTPFSMPPQQVRIGDRINTTMIVDKIYKILADALAS